MEKERKYPEIEPPFKIEGTPKEARAAFYEFAKKRIKYLSQEEFIKSDRDTGGFPDKKHLSPAFQIIVPEPLQKGDNLEKWVNRLEIAVNKDAFKIKDKDYSDVMPFVAEHEIYEAWLEAKKGTGPTLDYKKRHLLAHRKAFFLAEQQGLGDKFLEWVKLIAPGSTKSIEQCEYALKVAKRQLGRKELPLKHIEEPEVFASGSESVVFKFKPEKGKEYVYKEVKPYARALQGQYFGKTLEQKVVSMQKTYEILKEYCGDRIIDTHYIIGKNRKGKPTLIMVQEEIKGTLWSSISYKDRKHSKAWKQLEKVEKLVPKILKDPRTAKYYNTKYDPFRELTFSGNLFVDKNDNLKIIDW